jgi:hypothetical protein
MVTTSVTDPLVSLESDLTVFATPTQLTTTGTPGDWKSTTAGTPATLLATAQTVIGLLAGVGSVGNAITTLGSSLASALGVAADVLNAVGDAIVQVAGSAKTPTDITAAIATLQSTIASVQSSVPGGVPIFAAGDSFINSFTTYLNGAAAETTADLDAAATAAYQMSQQFRAIGAALKG